MGGNPDAVHVGDRLVMTDLRVGKSYPVTVVAIEGDGRAVVSRDDNGLHYRVALGFLTVRDEEA